MEEERKISFFLEQIRQPAFLVRADQIQDLNQAASTLMLASGQSFSTLLCTGTREYTDFQEGQICLTLTIDGHNHSAVISRMEEGDVVILDSQEDAEELCSMALVSMELRRPLMQAISSAQSHPSDAKLNQSLMQMLRLVSNMADISRYSTSSRMETRDVDAFLLELFEKAQTLTEGRMRLSFVGLRQPVFSQIDPEQLERAVYNILSNCIKFLPQEGYIHASLKRCGRMLHLTIEDSGSGIAEDIRANLFHRYLRQPGIEDRRYGLGLGLAIVRRAAANHGGTLLIGTGKDGGTKITMTMAIRQEERPQLHSPVFRPDYTGGWDHALVELSDCLPSEYYQEL